jgi:hypothetical protein
MAMTALSGVATRDSGGGYGLSARWLTVVHRLLRWPRDDDCLACAVSGGRVSAAC